MNKTELITAVAEKAEISKKDSEKALKAFIDVVTEELKKGEKVQSVDSFNEWLLLSQHPTCLRNLTSFPT